MAWNNANELVVGGGGQLYTAPSGTTVPTTTTGALNAAFVGLGYLDEDGLTLSVTPNIQEFAVWQSRQPARREALAQEILLSCKLAQWDEDTIPVAFGGGSVTGSTPNFKFSFPADTDALKEVAVVADVTDGTENHRFVFERANPTEAAEVVFNRSALAVLPLGLKVLAPAAGGSPGAYYTDSAGFAAGS
jgi:hypothetical protein